jgi:hypothetical protein
MTTTIVPGLGQAAVFTQQGPGASPGYAALDVRRAVSQPAVQEGVSGTGTSSQDFMVQQRIAGANMQVEITMTGLAMVQGDSVGGQGLYTVVSHSANVLETIATADATNPRIDQVILEVQDNVHDASGGNLARTRVLTGTPTAGATLANRTGAAALPGNALLLADVLVGAAVGSITNAVIRDRRKWARGAFHVIARTSGDYTTAGALAAVDAVNLNPRIECSGMSMRLSLLTEVRHSVLGSNIQVAHTMDGAIVGNQFEFSPPTAARDFGLDHFVTIVPAAGSHLFAPQWSSAATATMRANGSGQPLYFMVEEIIRQITPNNTVTTG